MLTLTPGVSHIIISLSDLLQPVVKSCKIDNGKVIPEDKEVIV
jgi:hypothetical protein